MAPADNLHVWRLADGVQVASFYQRSQTNWAPQWTDDERICVRTVTNTVQIFRDGDFKNGRSTLTIERVGAVALAPVRAPASPSPSFRPGPGSLRVFFVGVWQTGGARPLLAAFVPESKGAPATVKLVSLNENNAVVASKTFFQAREARMHWSPTGTDVVMPGDNLNVHIESVATVPIEEGLRFTVREGGRTVGTGVVTKILS